MGKYEAYAPAQLLEELEELQVQYEARKARGLKLDLARGKPDSEQTALSKGLLTNLGEGDTLLAENGQEIGNYGMLEGIPEARRLMGEILELPAEQVFVGGNSSLNLMHDCLGYAFLHGMPDSKRPWCRLPAVKFLCPSPGYDRHFAVTEHFGVEMLIVPMTPTGPDMDAVEALVAEDDTIKGMWCIPKYSNPTGITYSDDTVRRLARMKAAAADFAIFWDNAYVVHHLFPEEPDILLNIVAEAAEAGNPNRVLAFTSTSKVTFPGGGIAAVGSSLENIRYLAGHFSLQTIGFDKLNQLRHARFFGSLDGINEHMKKHAALLLPKFQAVLDTLEEQLAGRVNAHWEKPRGGYFVSLDTPKGCAKRTLELCKAAGVTMTPAGATFPYGEDPGDSNIRIAPTYAKLDEVAPAVELLCLCVRIASIEKLLAASAASRAS